jgi:hypothetical protein
VTGKNVSITIGGNVDATFTCTLDTGTPTACTSPLQLTNLTEGQHTLRVTQTDSGSETPSDAAPISWTVDTTPPAAPVITTKPQTSVLPCVKR